MSTRLSPIIRKMFDEYVSEGRLSSGFMRAVLENNLLEAVTHADDLNAVQLREIAVFAHNELPSSCWGSKDKVDAWTAHLGTRGLTQEIARGWYAPRN